MLAKATAQSNSPAPPKTPEDELEAYLDGDSDEDEYPEASKEAPLRLPSQPIDDGLGGSDDDDGPPMEAIEEAPSSQGEVQQSSRDDAMRKK